MMVPPNPEGSISKTDWFIGNRDAPTLIPTTEMKYKLLYTGLGRIGVYITWPFGTAASPKYMVLVAELLHCQSTRQYENLYPK